MKYFICLFMALCVSFVSGPVLAQRSDSIAAVVNGDVITYTDLYDRMDLVIKSSRMPNTKDFKSKLLPQILTGLITEQVQLQQANKLGLSVSEEEIDQGFAQLAAQNNMNAKQFMAMLKSQNVRMETIQNQIESQLAWGKVVQARIRPRITLTESDIDDEYQRLKSKDGQTEYNLAEIFLPLEKGVNKSQAFAAAKDLAKQLNADPRKFPAAARQFSQSATAASGGIIGWVTLDQLDETIAETINGMKPQSVSKPMETDDGYRIFFLRDKRTINIGGQNDKETYRIKAASFQRPETESARNALDDDIKNFRDDVKGCLDIVKQTANRKNAQLQDYNDLADNIPSNLVNAVDGVSIGEFGDTITTDETIIVPMLCAKSGGEEGTAAKKEIENRMGMQRMDVLQKRYLRDLISEAYIERRV